MDFEVVLTLLTLTGLEIILGIDNIVVIAIIAATLPVHQREKALIIGLSLAMITRLLLLFSLSWIAGLTAPIATLGTFEISGRDLLMLAGGVFLIVKAVTEMHAAVAEEGEHGGGRRATSFRNALAQIVMLDIVFSFDSVITAVGMANQLWVMATAVIIAVIVMLIASGPIIRFIHVNPSVKMLALAFVLLIGVILCADGFGYPIPKGYLYFAMMFSVFVAGLNIIWSRRVERRAAARAAAENGDAKSESATA
ncbi:MAG: TerC family protein [Alphaproteobacteria bacterium]|nr:TerC family protein [Alphaproteobacteria bacterium]